MRSSDRRQFLRLTAAVITTAVVLPSLAMGEDSAVDKFLADPAKAFQNYPNGGALLISLIRDVAVAHPEALNSIIAQLKTANVDQQSAIGSGLGQAAQIVAKSNPTYANQIQQAVAAAGSDATLTSFASVTGNVNIAATGGGGAGGGGGTGGGGGVGGGGGTGGGGGVGGGNIGGGLPTGGSFTGGSGTPGGFNVSNSSTSLFTGGGTGGAIVTSPF